jgi:uncharacterized membrane protein
MSSVLVVLASFLASSVEMVEALTIVLAVGLTHGWRTALIGVVSALLALAVVVAVLGQSIADINLQVLQITIGVLLLIFGLQWLRKAILRASGLKAKHDEAKIFETEMKELERIPVANDVLDWTGFVVSFKGVFLEGLEVAFIVFTFGANEGEWGLSAAGALLAFIVVGAIGALVHRPLARVPENAIKFAVGLLLVSFGTFWGGEGVGIEWTLEDAMIPLLAVIYAGVAFGLVQYLKQPAPAALAVVAEGAEG